MEDKPYTLKLEALFKWSFENGGVLFIFKTPWFMREVPGSNQLVAALIPLMRCHLMEELSRPSTKWANRDYGILSFTTDALKVKHRTHLSVKFMNYCEEHQCYHDEEKQKTEWTFYKAFIISIFFLFCYMKQVSNTFLF